MKKDAMRRALRQQFDPPIPSEKIERALARVPDEIPTSTVEKEARRLVNRAKRDAAQRKFRVWCKWQRIPMPVAEYPLPKPKELSKRRHASWRFDFAWPDVDGNGGVYLEVDGGGHIRGRHHRPAGFREDQVKRNAAVRLGWRPIHCTPQTLYTDATAATLRALLCVREEAV